MAVIWGLDLHDMQWSKFKSTYMFGNRDYHLRRTKFVVYQIAMILCVCSESVGTAALSDYVKEQSLIQNLHSSARVRNDAFVGIASYNIFVGIAVATIYGAGFFFDLFWPERYEPTNIRWAWRISGVVVTIMCLADALAITVIVATYSATITANNTDQRKIALEAVNPPLVYRHNGRAIAAVVFIWPGFVATVASTVILWMSYRHNELYGPLSTSGRARRNAEKTAPGEATDVNSVQFSRSRGHSRAPTHQSQTQQSETNQA